MAAGKPFAKSRKAARGTDAAAKPPQKKETLLESIAGMAAVLVSALFITTFSLHAFAIPTGSMENTLLIGDHAFVDRISLAPPTSWAPGVPYRAVHRGEPLVFLKPGEPGMHLVKRVIGVPGDRIHLLRGIVYVNGVPQAEPYVIHSLGNYDAFRDDFPNARPRASDPLTPEWRLFLPANVRDGDLVVPPDCYFGLGDNRDNSLDSRYWGFIPRANVIGAPLVIYWSFETPPDDYLRTSLRERAYATVNMVLHFFDETRWRRMGSVVR